MAKIKIENVVASTSLGHELDLQAIALALGGAEYEPEQFPGLIYRLKEPKTATLLFRSGKGGSSPAWCTASTSPRWSSCCSGAGSSCARGRASPRTSRTRWSASRAS